MIRLRRLINSRAYFAWAIAILLGVVFTLLHDEAQRILVPLGEWGRLRFVAKNADPFLAENVLNFFFQIIASAGPTLIVIVLMTHLLILRSMLYPTITILTHLAMSLWWVPVGVVVGFSPQILPALPLIPVSVFGVLLIFLAASFFTVRAKAQDENPL
jgi:hypothetical protein